MELFKIILLITAYTMGILTITLQVLCYLRDMEYKETLLLSASFLLLIITFSLTEFTVGGPWHFPEAYTFLVHFFCLALAVAIPVNMHKERIMKNERLWTRVAIGMGALLAVILIGGYFAGFAELANTTVMGYLLISIIYSMGLAIRTPPSLLIRHREKEERKSALFFLIFIPVYSLIGFLNLHYEFLSRSLFDGIFLCSIIFIALAWSKVTDDFKRLSLFGTEDKTKLADKAKLYQISTRELEVAERLLQGDSYLKIAETLFISLPTVKTHVANIYKKTGVNNKVELINLLNS